MAKLVGSNALLRGLSGRIGDLIFKQTKHGTIVSRAPHKPSAGSWRKRHNERFGRAAAYASAINKDPERRAEYAATLQPGQTVYKAAFREYMRSSDCERFE